MSKQNQTDNSDEGAAGAYVLIFIILAMPACAVGQFLVSNPMLPIWKQVGLVLLFGVVVILLLNAAWNEL
jgi:hypothetical protein